MVKVLVALFTICCISLSAFGQGSIKGTVYYLNSNKLAAQGVAIKATGSNGAYSKSDGSYTLKFPHKKAGESVEVSIGDKLLIGEEFKPIELVNKDILERVNIPLHPDLSTLRIIVCPKGFRDFIAQKYYNIIKTSADKALQNKKLEIDDLKLKLGKTHHLVHEKQSQLALYIRQNEDTITFYKEAYKIASINRDFASDRVKRYLDKLDLGIEIEEARKELSSKKAFEEIKEAELNFDASLIEITYDAQKNEGLDTFSFTLKKYDSINTLFRGKLLNPIQLIDNLIFQGQVCQTKKLNEKAISYYKEAQRLLNNYTYNETKKIVVSNNLSALQTGDMYSNQLLSILHSASLSKEQLALNVFFDRNGKGMFYEDITDYRIKASVFNSPNNVQAFEKLVHNSEAICAIIKNNIGISQRKNAQLEKAEESFLEALAINKRLATINPSYYNYYLARTYLQLAQLQAQNYKQKTRRRTKTKGLEYIDKSKTLLNNYDIEVTIIKELLKKLTTTELTFR